jgi:hypothetical protein
MFTIDLWHPELRLKNVIAELDGFAASDFDPEIHAIVARSIQNLLVLAGRRGFKLALKRRHLQERLSDRFLAGLPAARRTVPVPMPISIAIASQDRP